MKRLFVLIITSVICIALTQARQWRVADVPNVQVADASRYLVNPDNIISPAAQQRIDAALSSLRSTTTCEVSVVVVDDIDQDIDSWATELFEKWTPGKKDKDNGLLVVVAREPRKAVIRTGYGVEGVLPDMVCYRILKDQMFPAFRRGDYDGGVEATVAELSRLIADPEAAEELRSELADNSADDDAEFFRIYTILGIIACVVMLLIVVATAWTSRRMPDSERYEVMAKKRLMLILVTVFFIGVPLPALLVAIGLMWYWRNHRRRCPNCHKAMKRLDEVTDNEYLTPAQDMEERVGSVDYDVWLCPNCGETDILPYINHASPMYECPRCHARTAQLVMARDVVQPTTRHEGHGVKVYRCANCGNEWEEPYTIPRREAPVVVLPMGGGRGGFGGGGSLGGGFGGGFTGGGGASGGW